MIIVAPIEHGLRLLQMRASCRLMTDGGSWVVTGGVTERARAARRLSSLMDEVARARSVAEVCT
jgi:hypothetical protein